MVILYAEQYASTVWDTQAENLEKQLGTFGRAKRKVDELQRVIADSRRAGH